VKGAALGFIALAACSSSGGDNTGRSGLPESEKLLQLDDSGKDDLCAYQVEVEGTQPTTCGGDLMVTPKTKAECVAGLAMLSPQCTATVSTAEDCFDAIGADPCNFGGAACNALIACSMSPLR
jgi:hypothetical protein